MVKHVKSLTETQEYESTYIPERRLLASTLYQALHDITHSKSAAVRNSCIAWFMYDGIRDQRSRGFYFQDIVEELDLATTYVNLIFRYIDKISYDHKLKKEGEQGRTGDCELSEGIRVSKYQTDPAIQRLGRIGRYRVGRVTPLAHRVQGNKIRTPNKKSA